MRVSQIQVPRQEWDKREPFKCVATHAAGNAEADFIKPRKTYTKSYINIIADLKSSSFTW